MVEQSHRETAIRRLRRVHGRPSAPYRRYFLSSRRRSGRTRKGSKWLNVALKDAAMAATRTNGSYLQAQYQRLRPRVGHGRALGAVKHSIICACWHMLTTGELYRDLGSDYFQRANPERATRRLVKQLEALGHRVTLEPMPMAA